MQAGYADYLALRHAMNLPLLETGAMVVAWIAAQEAALPEILAAAHRNGVTDTRLMTPSEIAGREPNLVQTRAAVLVPGEHEIDPWSPIHGYTIEILGLGGTILRQTEVTSGQFDGAQWQINTSRGRFHATAVISCAGLHGDRIELHFWAVPISPSNRARASSWCLTRPLPLCFTRSSCPSPTPGPRAWT